MHFRISTMLLLLTAPLLALSNDNLDLVEFAKKQRFDDMRLLLKKESVDVNETTADGTTALHWAVHWGNSDIVDLLLSAGAYVSPSNDYGVTPLWQACLNKDSDMVEKLIYAGADLNAKRITGESILMRCAQTGAEKAVDALLDAGADIHAKENRKAQTALMWASAGGHARVVKSLVESGAEISGKTNGGFSPLLFAAYSGDVESARLLLNAGADPDEATAESGNALVVATASGHEELALLLLARGASPDSADAYGITPLHYAVRSGLSNLNGIRYDPVYRIHPPNMSKLAKALLEAGADPNVQIIKEHRIGPDGSPFSMEGATPFMLAAISADVELMLMMGEYGADPKINADGGNTALMAAARAACTGSCAFQGGNNANKEDTESSLNAVKAVIEMGVDVNAANEDGRTAMHMAAFTGANSVVQYLADHGADVNSKDVNGETPWSMASGLSPGLRYRGLYGTHEITAALLVKLGAHPVSLEEMNSKAQHNQ